MNEIQIRAVSGALGASRPDLESMTFPAYRELLGESRITPEIRAVASSHDGRPVGLGLARRADNEAEILSLFVRQEFRNRGIGASLLASLEEELRISGATVARVTYNTSSASAKSMERILESRNWSTPEPSMLLVQVGREIMEAPWFGARKLPPEFEIFPWSALTESERRNMEKSQTMAPWAPDNLWPFQYESDIERCNSLGLRRRGEIVGWVITNRIGPKAVRYTSAFVREEHRHPGRTFILASEAIRRQAEILGYDSIGTFGVQMGQEPMIRVVRRKFAPWLRSISETRVSRKSLDVGQGFT